MKKTLLILAAGATLLSASSCTKDFTCTCIQPDFGGGFGSTTVVTTFEKTTRADAAAACPESQTISTGGGSFTLTCDLDKD